jgi:lactoylglutathione lyase
MATELFPIIATPDMGRSLGFYRDLLGATVSYEFAGPDGATVYAGLDIGRSHLGIGHDPDAAAGAATVSLWIYVHDFDTTIATASGSRRGNP